MMTPKTPKCIVGEKAYDSDPFDEAMGDEGIEKIAPHQTN